MQMQGTDQLDEHNYNVNHCVGLQSHQICTPICITEQL